MKWIVESGTRTKDSIHNEYEVVSGHWRMGSGKIGLQVGSELKLVTSRLCSVTGSWLSGQVSSGWSQVTFDTEWLKQEYSDCLVKGSAERR